jgi:galactokinase
MNTKTLLERISAPEAASVFEPLYGEAEEARERYADLVEGLAKMLADDNPSDAEKDEIRLFTAAGRTELGGNHTDHNCGKVLAASIQLDAVAAVAKRTDKKAVFRSKGFPDVVVDLSVLSVSEAELGTTEGLLRGIAAEFERRGVALGGWTANADSTVLPGSGLSSSAAVGVLLGTIFNHLYAGGKFTPLQIAQIGQFAENTYFGKPSGLMDQTASASGGVVVIDFADNKNPAVEHIDFNPTAFGYALCVVDTKGSHADLTPDYAAIPGEMKAVARFFNKDALRETTLAAVLSKASDIRKQCGDRALLRALHYFNENDRVEAMTDELKTLPQSGTPSLQKYLTLVNESGVSSFEQLQNAYSTQNPDHQGIPLALSLTREFFKKSTENYACRVHGGGFAGTVQAYIPLEQVSTYKKSMEKVFGKDSVTVLRIRATGTAEVVL